MPNSQDNNISENQDTYPNKDRASGYVDEAGRAVGESLVNRVTELMVGPQTKLVQLAAQMDATTKLQDQRFQYLLGQLGAFLEKEDARHSAYDESEQSTLQALTSVAHRLDEITGYVQQSVTIAREALTVSKAGTARLGKMTKRVDAHADQIKEIVARLDHKREVQQEHAARIQALEDNNTRLDTLEAEVRRLTSERHGTE